MIRNPHHRMAESSRRQAALRICEDHSTRREQEDPVEQSGLIALEAIVKRFWKPSVERMQIEGGCSARGKDKGFGGQHHNFLITAIVTSSSGGQYA